jgi:hypothetical protein
MAVCASIICFMQLSVLPFFTSAFDISSRRLFLLRSISHFGNHRIHLFHVSIGAFPWDTVSGDYRVTVTKASMIVALGMSFSPLPLRCLSSHAKQ